MYIPSFSKTPTVTVLDNRGLNVRYIAYHRHPDTPDVTSERITRHQYDARGALSRSADPRLQAARLTNFIYLTDLAGSVMRTVSTDAGTTVALSDTAGRPFIAVSNIRIADDGTADRSQAVTRRWQYEEASLSGRPLSITEQTPDGMSRTAERFVYAGNTDAEQALNLAGQCVSHYDTAGLVQTNSIALTGESLSVTRRLLKDADNPDTVADWQGGDASAWNDQLDGEAYTTLTTADATGAVLTTKDAKGNQQRMAYDVAGLLSGNWLTVKDGTEQIIVKSLTYSAAGQKLREEHGNGVVTTYTYEPQTQRLTGMKTERPAGHASGAKVLQDLRYKYDPVGNVLKVSNDAEETRFWRNQKVVPENTYAYDSLYQLVSATGREMANARQQGSNLPSAAVPLPTDSSAFTNYTRTYSYDNAGNLTQIRHSAPATNNSYTTDITVSESSNQGVLSTLTENPSEVDMLFTAGGLQRQLQPGQSLIWTPRNELLKVTPVVRDGSTDDRESYRYDAGSQRILKVSVQKTGNNVQTQRVLYLPGLELRSTKAGDTGTEGLQVITVGVADRAQVRVLHWETGQPAGIHTNQIRYSYDNLAGSGQLELDGDGNIISMEEYYPYGGTAVWAVRSAVEAEYKTIRYSGKERDATGMYYYGYRYYQPWAGRWLSADPAGTVDGLNLFRMCRNNPVTLRDEDGLISSAQLEQITSNILKRNPGSIDDVKNALSYMQLTAEDVNSIVRHIQQVPQFSNKKSETTERKSAEIQSVLFSFHEETKFDKNALIYIANPENFSHTFKDDGSILSVSKKHPKNSKFLNRFGKEKWDFISNFREGGRGEISREPYFASHIAQHQYALSSEKFNFVGMLPKQVVRVDVLNSGTLNETYGLSGDELFNAFFLRTPNGKSTKRVLESFGLEAYSVMKTVEHSENVNFNIKVRKNPSATIKGQCNNI
ncbi:RHS repeat protein [Serratia inhibens]|uniref:RHS repeat protein n=1 Tax=Serratia inhibens TaxID=2338073 RepID=UPI001FD610CB|nr:RHS repeat domain-containing protein [Serratia inhibens]